MMITFKCKMCGGDLHPEENATTCECEYCGSVQTIPTADSEKKGNLFNRANRLRISAEYDKAATVYASITAEFPEEAEAYWGLCLCKYGIEYVEDPATAKKIPTCHRTRTESIMDDADFEQACENADAVAKRVYREEAKAIDRLQQDILSVVAGESPYDVFICYKETDENGQRTEDSVLAQDIYDALTAKGLKVFFARITLEDKLGRQYEPYIYAALHSAKVMLAIGTQFEYFDAVWVKNEWARFLDMMKSDRSKTLIPCYKGIDAYDIPREFKNLQAQDMGKLGWLQDLTRGVMKLCGKGEQSVQQTDQMIPKETNPTVVSLLERGYITLEDGQWEKAEELFDRVLNIDPKNADAYMGQLMIAGHYNNKESFKKAYIRGSVIESSTFQRIREYADEDMSAWLAMLDEEKQKYELSIQQAIRFDLLYNEYVNKWQSLRDDAVKHQVEADLDWIQYKEQIRVNSLEKQEETKDFVTQCKEINGTLSNLQRDLTSLGLFHVKEKKEIRARIEAKKIELSSLNQKISDIEQEYDCYISNASRKIEEIQRAAVMEYEKQNPRPTQEAFAFREDMVKAFEIYKKYQSVKKGGYLLYGRYPYSGNGDIRPIEWIVLELNSEKVTLLSRFVLDAEKYNEVATTVSWQDCTIRNWLNSTFMNNAFNESEQNNLMPENGERVSLLSERDFFKLLPGDAERIAKATPYATAKSNGDSITANGNAAWALRLTGQANRYPDITGLGKIVENTIVPANNPCLIALICGVRPVIKVSTKGLLANMMQ